MDLGQHTRAMTDASLRGCLPAHVPLTVLPAGPLAELAARLLIQRIECSLSRQAYFLLAPSAGRTFAATYAVLCRRFATTIDWRRVVCVQMDEYAGLGCSDPRAFVWQLRTQLVEPLGMGRLLHFNDEQGQLLKPLEAYEEQIRRLGGLDCVMHGVGCNSHVAFNEPAKRLITRTRRVRLATSTRAANAVEFRQGVTLGLDVLLAARSSIVALQGSAKRAAAHHLLNGNVSAKHPVSYLRHAPNLTVLLDPDACPASARELQSTG